MTRRFSWFQASFSGFPFPRPIHHTRPVPFPPGLVYFFCSPFSYPPQRTAVRIQLFDSTYRNLETGYILHEAEGSASTYPHGPEPWTLFNAEGRITVYPTSFCRILFSLLSASSSTGTRYHSAGIGHRVEKCGGSKPPQQSPGANRYFSVSSVSGRGVACLGGQRGRQCFPTMSTGVCVLFIFSLACTFLDHWSGIVRVASCFC